MLMKRVLCNLGSSTVEKMVLEYAEFFFFFNKDFHCALKLLDVILIVLIKVNCWHFNIYEQDKFHAHEKIFM